MLQIGGQRIASSTVLVALFDILLITLALVAATALRLFEFHAIVQKLDTLTLARFAVVIVVCEFSLYYHDLYDFQVMTGRSVIFVQLLQAVGVACLILALTYYLCPNLSLGRGVAVLAAPASVALTLGWRLILNALGFFSAGSERVLIVGTGAAGIGLVREIGHRPELKLKVVGFLDEKGEDIGKSLVNPGIIGATADVLRIVRKEKVDRVVLSVREGRGFTPVRELLDLKFAGISVEDAHIFHEQIAGRISLADLSPNWLILSKGFRRSAFLLASKRAMDIVLSLFAMLFTFPLMGLMVLVIWLETGSPILFRQKRIGLGGREFEILKFRSMFQDAEQDGPRWAAQDDHRVTPRGKFLRKFRLDELPQLFNVLRGEMSLIGPRPERPTFCELLGSEIPFFNLRHSVRPGITGWAQVKYQYGSSIEEARMKLEYDLFYLKHLSIALDLAIILETVKVILYGRGAK
jgi:sugar transferase (PEP-CTERM system associated)